MHLLKSHPIEENGINKKITMYLLSPDDKVQVDGVMHPEVVKRGIFGKGIKNYSNGCYMVGITQNVHEGVLHVNGNSESLLTFDQANSHYEYLITKYSLND